MNASLNSSANLFSQLLLPLQGVVDFFSPPVLSRIQPAPSFSGKVLGAQPRLAKAPAFPSSAKHGSVGVSQTKLQHAGIRLSQESGIRQSQESGIRLVGQGLMGQMHQAPSTMSAEQILRSRRAQDGRIVISGRMRDVCAELDRLCDERV